MKRKTKKRTLIVLAMAIFIIINLLPINVLSPLADGVIELTQQDFSDAFDNSRFNQGGSVKGITYDLTQQWYILSEGSYKFTEDIESIAFFPLIKAIE